MRQLITFFVRYPYWTNTLIVLILLGGLFTAILIKKDRFPDRPVREIQVQVSLPGASPHEVEEGITQRIEEALKGITGIDEYTSVSSENSATITVVGLKGYDVDDLLSDVKNAVDRINSFPENAEKPKIFKMEPRSNAMYFTLFGDVSLHSLKQKAEEIEDDFLASGLMSKVYVKDHPELEIAIEVKKETLLKYGLTFEDIASAVKTNNRDISGGILRTPTQDFLIRSDLKETNTAKIGNIPVKALPDGSYLLLKDIATVKKQFSESPTQTLLNGKPGVSIDVEIIPGEDLLKMSNFLHEYYETFNRENNVYELTINFDASISVRSRLHLLLENGAIGLLLVVLSLGLFLNLKLSFWVAMGIPVSLCAMLMLASLCGVTINQITMFGMILVIGILVDDGIVIAENIHAKLERGVAPLKATVEGTLEVLPAVFTSIMTTVIAFSTLFFMDGRIGEFMVEMAIVVILALSFSLIEATIVLPGHLYTKKDVTKTGRIRQKINSAIDFVRYKLYGDYLNFSLKWRWVFALLPLAFTAIVFAMFFGGSIKSSYFPSLDRDIININLEFEPGTPADTTLKYLKYMESKVIEVNDSLRERHKKDILISTKIRVAEGGMLSGHMGEIRIQVLPLEERKIDGEEINSHDLAAAIRKKAGPIPNAKKSTVEVRGWFGKALSYYLVGKDHEELEKAKEELLERLNNDPRLANVIDDDILGMQEIQLQIKPTAKFLGLSNSDIASQIRQGFFGLEAQRLQIGSDEVKVWVRYEKEDRSSLGSLANVKITSRTGGEYTLSNIADFSIDRDQISIKHYNGAREVNINADMADADAPAKDIVDEISATVLADILKKYPSVRKISGGQERENEKMQLSMSQTLPVIIILMFTIISLTFRSFFQTFLIIFMIPVGIAGGMFGHYIHDITMVVMSWFGCVAVAGVVVNDAVVFLDKFNRNIKSGLRVQSAVFDAGVSRFRPILLTSITTVLGLYPLIWQQSLQAQFLIPMAIEIAFGVLVGTLLIILCFPAWIMTYNDLRRGFVWFWTGIKPTAEEVEPAYREQKRLKTIKSDEN